MAGQGYSTFVSSSVSSSAWPMSIIVRPLRADKQTDAGVLLSFVAMIFICWISPPPNLGEGLNYLDDADPMGNGAATVNPEASDYVDTKDPSAVATVAVLPA
jgi:hypothetical protein